ncbi:hypothetical protein LCGC14_0560030 [marine sediment metagenome]|uniref:Uncharacterized protein n=1 Tax=marine sediment metagenome TaxID=412755 RepID=A0A0F9U8P8_9ZZZZ
MDEEEKNNKLIVDLKMGDIRVLITGTDENKDYEFAVQGGAPIRVGIPFIKEILDELKEGK